MVILDMTWVDAEFPADAAPSDSGVDASSCPLYYRDADNDGFGTGDDESRICEESSTLGYARCAGDCNDLDSSIRPGLIDTIGDGIDNNCDGIVDPLCRGALAPCSTDADCCAGDSCVDLNYYSEAFGYLDTWPTLARSYCYPRAESLPLVRGSKASGVTSMRSAIWD